MLSVTLILINVAAALLGVVVPVINIHVDSLNDPTPQPNPRGKLQIVDC